MWSWVLLCHPRYNTAMPNLVSKDPASEEKESLCNINHFCFQQITTQLHASVGQRRNDYMHQPKVKNAPFVRFSWIKRIRLFLICLVFTL